MRYSRQREAVLEVLKSTTCHPDAEWIYDRVRQQIPDISLGTVYRNLKLLSDNGDILTLETEFGKIHYDGNVGTHAHFICTECKRVSDIFIRSGMSGKLEEMGYIPKSEKTVFYGKCIECAGCGK